MHAALHPALTPLAPMELGKLATRAPALKPRFGGVKFHATTSKNMWKLEQIQHQH